ncbi:MAG TPA: hypothetical protein VLJ44_06165 [Gaiellaceae bacterium]|nr:hypothetical protein [Gaiellaceae bacterium]
MRRVLSLLVLVAALSVVGAAAAAPGSSVACGGTCDPGRGYTGCKTISGSHGASAWLVYSIRHVIVVSYCKRNGVITSISIAAHYCDSAGLVSCSPSAAWKTGGGVGSTWATFEGHAQWTVNTLHIYNNTDVVTLTVPTIDG